MAISRHASANQGLDTLGSYTVGSGANRLLVWGMFAGFADGTPTPTYNSTALSLIASGVGTGDRWTYLFCQLAPSSGSNALGLSWVSAPDHYEIYLSDYDGVKQTGQPDAFDNKATFGGAAITVNPNVVAANCWIVGMHRENAGTTTTWTGATELIAGGGGHLADSNGTVSTGSYTLTASSGGAAQYLIGASFAPDTGGGGGGKPWLYYDAMSRNYCQRQPSFSRQRDSGLWTPDAPLLRAA